MVKVIRTVCKEGICPVCGGQVKYTDASPDYVSWYCPHCNASGDEGADYVAEQGEKVFDGYHYNVVDGMGNPVAILDPSSSGVCESNAVYVIVTERNFTGGQIETKLTVADYDYKRALSSLENVFRNEQCALKYLPVQKNCFATDCKVENGKDLYKVSRSVYEDSGCGCSYAGSQSTVVKLVKVVVTDPIPSANVEPAKYTMKVYYGIDRNESNIAFLTEASAPKDNSDIAAKLAAELEIDPSPFDFHWGWEEIPIPDDIVRKIKAAGIAEYVRNTYIQGGALNED